ncbi:MAG: sulfurtransferase [Chromatiales bacterium]|jgi:3-mercaptopyruvate sulfurtransferase SseA|nr:sulfurtransferase [Chromatiales bacterium]MDX9766618.1 sulfurtransferase [Ectothiorhodospiraceae bacterium]
MRDISLSSTHWLRSAVLGSAVALALVGCGGGEDTSGANPVAQNVHTPAQIAQESADNYNDNVNGLITGATLKRWMGDWVNQRPPGVTGKLVILQSSAGPEGFEFVKPDNKTVFTYQVPTSEWVQTRSNGVIQTVSMVPDGPTIDALLKKYGIDPNNDMIVCSMGTGSFSLAMNQGRCWYMFRYWGLDKKNLAILNGSNDWQVTSGAMTAADFAATASNPPNNGIWSVRDVPNDNTALQASVEDMINVVTSSDVNDLTDGVFIWDARSIDQYSAGEIDENGNVPANYMSTFQNSGSRQGHPNGTLQLNYVNMLLAAQGYSYKPKSQLMAYLDGQVDAAGKGFSDSTYQHVGVGNAYQPGDTIYAYCETTFRAMITGVASAVILGKPTRFYDGAMVEWNSLSSIVAADGNPILPADSPWRTDLASRSYFKPASSPLLIATRQITDPYAATANKIINDDRAYKLGTGGNGGSTGGGGGGAPSNPCGG